MKKFSNKINESFTGPFVVGDRVMVDKGLTTDPANRQGHYGDVVHITKSGDTVVEFSDGGIGVYSSGLIGDAPSDRF